MTTAQKNGLTSGATLSGQYPTLLRMGHRFETSFGQRLIIDGLYGAMDMAFAGDDWIYVLNKYETQSVYPRVRFAVCNINDEFPRNIEPLIDGKPQVHGEEVFPSPMMCDSDGKGTLYFTDEHANKIVALDTNGNVLNSWGEAGDGSGQLNAPAGITFAPDGTLWVVSTRSSLVQNFTTDGTYLGGFGERGNGPGQMDHPWGVAIDPVNGSVLVADWRNDRIQRFSPAGEHLQTISHAGKNHGKLNRPSDVAVDPHGDIYVCDRGNDRVLQFNPRGVFIESFIGDATMTERGADKLMANQDMLRWRDHIEDLDREKRFWKPTAVKLDDQFRIYVVDQARYRVQVYRKTFRVLKAGEVEPAETYRDPKIN
jgi:DNA-binding beta-propeller fold protein YncE